MMETRKIRLRYILADYLSTLAGVAVFDSLRYYADPTISPVYNGLSHFLQAPGVLFSFLLFPPLMLLIYYLTGYYENIYNKSRVMEFLKTLLASLTGSIIFFLVVLINDWQPFRKDFYILLGLMWISLSICVYATRLAITTLLRKRFRRTHSMRPLILVSETLPEKSLLTRLHDIVADYGMNITAIATPNVSTANAYGMPVIHIQSITEYAIAKSIEGFILLPSQRPVQETFNLLTTLLPLGKSVYVQPDDHLLMMSSVKFNTVTIEPLVDITRPDMPDSVLAIKRFSDIVVSSIGLLISSPVILVLGFIIKFQSPGAVFYRQERIGYRKKPFHIVKLRSMVSDSEPDGPKLSEEQDPRITPIGRFMRKYRLDELPNLWNVLKGEMSLVGPRPERAHYIELMQRHAPHVTLIHRVRPGLTSWGMVRYGYASDVDQMVERLRYDMLYLQNISLSLDMKILLYTLRTVFKGEGK